MASEYFILIDNIQKGPFPPDKLKSHGVTADTLVWRKGLQNWVKAREEPELRPHFPWQAPKKSKPAEPAPKEKEVEVEVETETKSEQPKKPDKVKPLKTNKAGSSKLDDLKEWFTNLEPKQRNILIGVVAAVVLVPLGIWGISAMFKKGPAGGFPVVQRQEDNEDDEPRKKKLVVKKKKKVNKKTKGPVGPVVKKKNDGKIPPGKLTEEYYQLVRDLSFDRAAGAATQRVRTNAALSDKYRKLASEAGVKSIKEFASRAANLFEPEKRPAPGVRRGVGGIGIGQAGGGAIRPDVLLAQMSGNLPDSTRYKFELELQKLWEDILVNMRNQLDNAGKLTPEIAELRWKPDPKRRSENLPDGKNALGRLRVTNTSNDTLFHVTMALTLRTAWGLSVTHHYYRDRWKANEDWRLAYGTRWGTAGEYQTVGGDVKIWADNKVMAATSFDFPDRRKIIVPETVTFCDARLQHGYYSVPLRVGTGLSKNENLQESWKDSARSIAKTAQRIKKSHEALLAATKPDTKFVGVWQFGKLNGKLGLKFEPVTRKPGTGVPFGRSSSVRTSDLSSPVQAALYETDAPTEYRSVVGELEFFPEEMEYGLTLRGGSIGVTGDPQRLPVNSRQYLLKTSKLEMRVRTDNGELWGSMKRGERFVFVPEGRINAESRLTELKQRRFGREIGRRTLTVERIPSEVLPRLDPVVPINLQWSADEVRRFDTAAERTKKKNNATSGPRKVLQVLFAPNGTEIYANTGGGNAGETFGWNARTGREDFRRKTGSPILISPNNIHIAVPNNSGTRLFKAGSGRERLDTRIDKSSTVVAFGPKGHKIMTASRDGRVEVFDVTGKSLLSGRHVVAVTAVAIGPDGKMALTATRDHKINIWDLTEGKFVEGFDSGRIQVDELRISPSGKYVMGFTLSREELDRLRTERQRKLRTAVKIREGIKNLVRIWDIESGKLMYSVMLGYDSNWVDISPDWKYALTAEQDGPVSLWDLRKGKEIHRFIGHPKPAKAVAFSGDGRFAASGGDDGYVILWGLPIEKMGGGKVPLPPDSKKTDQVAGGKSAKPPKPVPESVKKRNEALRKVQLAEAAVKSGRRIRASEFLREAESIAGQDPAVKRAIQKVRTLLGTSG